jgi:hypothetical protein
MKRPKHQALPKNKRGRIRKKPALLQPGGRKPGTGCMG